ncbi:MAG: FkbM family methyltransferase [Verrucomicrobiae bacterium]|nr:FkbM family methyltransferase [Verrucomicrobiae bacterium]
MKPPLYPRLERAFKQAYLLPLTILRYGAARPHRARLHQCANWIYIDPEDPCAIKKVVHEPLRGRVSSNLIFWREFNAYLQPELIVDVGLNYGECLFGTDYTPTAMLYGFEANPRLIPYLEKSRQQHPAGARMTITHCLVSDAPAENVPFLVNPEWSGSSSAIRQMNETHRHIEFKLPARTLDATIPATAADGKVLLFKMDLEGYESRALTGFATTLERTRQAFGFIEFTPKFIKWAELDPAAFFARLRDQFDIYCYARVKHRELWRIKEYADLFARHGPDFTGTDLLLMPQQAASTWLPPGWRVAH